MVRRTNRQILRVYLVLVLAAALFGGAYAADNWRPDLASLQQTELPGEGDWIDILAAFGEEAIQLFLGLAGGE